MTPRNFIAVDSDLCLTSRAILATSKTPNNKTLSNFKELFTPNSVSPSTKNTKKRVDVDVNRNHILNMINDNSKSPRLNQTPDLSQKFKEYSIRSHRQRMIIEKFMKK